MTSAGCVLCTASLRNTLTGSLGTAEPNTNNASIPTVTAVHTACSIAARLRLGKHTTAVPISASTNARIEISSRCASMLFPLADFLHQFLKLGPIHHFVLHQPDQQLLQRPVTEAVQYLPHGPHRHALRLFHAAVHERLPLQLVLDVTLVFETPQHGAHARILQEVRGREGFANLLSRPRAALP